jgi:hypothetical protein
VAPGYSARAACGRLHQTSNSLSNRVDRPIENLPQLIWRGRLVTVHWAIPLQLPTPVKLEHDPEKWAPVSRLREALGRIIRAA